MLLGWVAGISMMGRNLPNFISNLLPILIIFSCIVIAFTWLKRGVKPQLSFRFIFMQVIILAVTSFFLAWHYADHALAQRLANRVTQLSATEAIVYIAKINQLNTDENGQKLKQSAVVLHASELTFSKPIQLLLTTKSALQQPQLELGHYYRVTGTLKPAHSYAVAGVFDVEQWYLQDNIMGTLQIQSIQSLSKNQVSQ